MMLKNKKIRISFLNSQTIVLLSIFSLSIFFVFSHRVLALTGDLNNDNSVNIFDIQLEANVVAGNQTDPVIVARADVNNDGQRNIFDIQLVANIAAGTFTQDTLLMGFDSSLSPGCFMTARNIVNHSWKAFRWRASNSGQISYFKLRLPEATDSTNDEFAWAIYTDDSGSIGPLMAYGYYPSYNWTNTGVGEHKFNVTNVVTTNNISASSYYWLVAYSRDMDGETHTSSAVIPTERGNGECAPGITIMSTSQNQWLPINTPPPPGYYNAPMNSYHAWSVWMRGF